MNKQQFMIQLQKHLAPMPPEEKSELLSEYENHFLFGLQSGRTEEEIVRELGDPLELANEALGDRAPQLVIPSTGTSTTRTVFSVIMLFFLNLIMVPIGISIWAVVVSIGVTGIAGIFSPFLVFVDFMIGGELFSVSKFFLSIAFVGLGILFSIAGYYMAIGTWKITLAYLNWNITTVKGRNDI